MPQDRKKMLGILDRFEKQAIDQENMLDMSEDEILQQMIQRDAQHQQSRRIGDTTKNDNSDKTAPRKLTLRERNELIRKTIEEEQKEVLGEDQYQMQGQDGSLDIDHEQRKEMDRILEKEHQDLIDRFQGVNLDEETFESIWARLSSDERREFRERFMVPGMADEDEDEEEDEVGDRNSNIEGRITTEINTKANSSFEAEDDEESEARKLLQEMGETLQRGGKRVDEDDVSNPVLAELDTEDLRAIRDAEISELIPIWRPWWEIEAEQAGQLKKVTVSQVSDKEESERLNAGSINSIPQQKESSSSIVAEKFVLDEEAMLRPHQALVQDLDEVEREEKERQLAALAVPRMVRAPHPSLIYHISALLFSYVATSRVLNGDLKEEPEQTLAYIFDLCPFFSPLSSPTKSLANLNPSSPSTPATTTQSLPEVDDFETTLAIIQTSSLNSKLWKGDTLRLEMLSLLLRDLTLVFARPSRCLRSIQQLKDVFNSCMELSNTSIRENSKLATARKSKLFTKSVLHRLFKKLEFYESYLVSDEYLLKTDRLDRARTEVVMAGIRVRQEMLGWTRELENVTRVKEVDTGDSVDGERQSSTKKVLIEELP
ncbi:hypothetical protein BGZ49_008683 [Haplosporangium sp. Z 27]|nr:hypothetical protein BGZ49_008683 [Haplosporangium sp. Z 27]